MTIIFLRVILTAAFLYFGLRKLLAAKPDVEIYDAIGYGQWPRPITGSVEVICAILLWIPGLQGLAALGLFVTIFVGATALTLFTNLPRWHMVILLAGTATLAWHDRADILSLWVGA